MKRSALFLIIIFQLLILSSCNQGIKVTVAPTIAIQPTTEAAAVTAVPAATTAPAAARRSTPAAGNPAAQASLWVTNPQDHTALRIDPQTSSIVATIPIDGQADTVVTTDGAAWVLDRYFSRVYRIDPATNKVAAVIPLPTGQAETIAAGNGLVWVGATGRINLSAQAPGPEAEIVQPGLIAQIDPATNQISTRFPAQPVSRIEMNGNNLWVLSHGIIDTPLQVFDLTTSQGMAVTLQNGPDWLPADAMAVDGDSLWLLSAAYGKIFHAKPDGRIRSSISFEIRQPVGYSDLLVTDSGLWAILPWGTVLHIDPTTNHILGQIELNAPLTGLLSSPGAVWVLSQQTAMLFRIDPASNNIAAEIATGSLLAPTVVPSPTPRIVLWKPCQDAPTSRLKKGDLAYVTKDPPLPNRIRKDPNRQAEILGYIVPGGGMEIIDGPSCSDGWVWWKVKNADYTGWTPEGDQETYWLIPYYK